MRQEGEAQLSAAAHPVQVGFGGGAGLTDGVRAEVGQLDGLAKITQ